MPRWDVAVVVVAVMVSRAWHKIIQASTSTTDMCKMLLQWKHVRNVKPTLPGLTDVRDVSHVGKHHHDVQKHCYQQPPPETLRPAAARPLKAPKRRHLFEPSAGTTGPVANVLQKPRSVVVAALYSPHCGNDLLRRRRHADNLQLLRRQVRAALTGGAVPRFPRLTTLGC